MRCASGVNNCEMFVMFQIQIIQEGNESRSISVQSSNAAISKHVTDNRKGNCCQQCCTKENLKEQALLIATIVSVVVGVGVGIALRELKCSTSKKRKKI